MSRLSKAVIIAAHLLAIWPVLKWYCFRMLDSADEPWGLLALIVAVFYLFGKQQKAKANLLVPALLLLFYATTFFIFPPLVRAIIAATSLSMTLSVLYLGKLFHMGIWGLMCLSLPVLSSLQFYLGYPLRVIVGSVAAPLLQCMGYPVVREGVCLSCWGNLIAIDAPCSGIKMLWVGFFLAFTLICWRELSYRRSFICLIVTFFAVLLGNILRTTSLFFLEAKMIEFPTWSHTGVGVIAFVLSASFIIWWVYQKEPICAVSTL